MPGFGGQIPILTHQNVPTERCLEIGLFLLALWLCVCVFERLLFYKPTAIERQVWETCQVLATWQRLDAAMALLLFPFTPPKFNMEPENDGFQKESPFPGTPLFRFHVKLQGCTFHDQSLFWIASLRCCPSGNEWRGNVDD